MSKILKSFYLNGERSADHGLFISGDAVYNAPAYDYEVIQIPGRNGDLVMDNGRFNNITVTYPAFVTDVANLQDIRQWLLKNRGYQRIEDEYNPTEYRMGYFSGDFDVNVFANRAGSFELTFNCKPQRFLTIGERQIFWNMMKLDQTEQAYRTGSYPVDTAALLIDDEWDGVDPDDFLPALKKVIGTTTMTRSQLISYVDSQTKSIDLVTAGCSTGSDYVDVVIDHTGTYSGYYRSMFRIRTKSAGIWQEYPFGTHIKLRNPTNFIARPLISVSGYGSSSETIHIQTFEPFARRMSTPGNADFDIDTETWEAYNGDISYNSSVTLTDDQMPALMPGVNYVRVFLEVTSYTTQSASLTIVPRWWII